MGGGCYALCLYLVIAFPSPMPTAVTIITPMVLFSGLLYQRSKISGGLQWLADTSMVCSKAGGEGGAGGGGYIVNDLNVSHARRPPCR